MADNQVGKLMEGDYILTLKGNKTILKDEKNKIVVEAKCDPDDEFTATGIILCVSRMVDEKRTRQKAEEDKKIKVGDKVKVVDVGKSYTTYVEWIKKYAVQEEMIRYCYDSEPSTSSNYIVKQIHPHLSNPSLDICLLQKCDGFTYYFYLVGIDGLKKVTE